MFGMPKHRKGDPEPTLTGVVAGLVISTLATQFVRAAWNAAQQEGAKAALNPRPALRGERAGRGAVSA